MRGMLGMKSRPECARFSYRILTSYSGLGAALDTHQKVGLRLGFEGDTALWDVKNKQAELTMKDDLSPSQR